MSDNNFYNFMKGWFQMIFLLLLFALWMLLYMHEMTFLQNRIIFFNIIGSWNKHNNGFGLQIIFIDEEFYQQYARCRRIIFMHWHTRSFQWFFHGSGSWTWLTVKILINEVKFCELPNISLQNKETWKMKKDLLSKFNLSRT